MNVIEGEPSERQMTTGNHTVRDIYCVKCHTTLGWKYVRQPMCHEGRIRSGLTRDLMRVGTKQDFAYDQAQKYKEGKYILERNLLVDVQ